MGSSDSSPRRSRGDSSGGRRPSGRQPHPGSRVPWYVQAADFLDPSAFFGWLWWLAIGGAGDSRTTRRNRRRWQLALGLLLVLGTAGGVGWKLGLFDGPQPPTVAELLQQAAEATAQKDYPAALSLYDQLIELGAASEQTRFERALCLAALDQPDQALAAMEQLATRPSPSFPPAHLWLANRLLADPKLSSDHRRQAAEHLASAVEHDPQNVEAQRRLAELWVAEGKFQEALIPLERAADKNPEDRLRLAKLHYKLGNKSEGESAARDALASLTTRLEARPSDAEVRKSVVQAAALLGDYPLAEERLREGFKRADDRHADFERLLSELYCLWSIDEISAGRPQRAIELLRDAERLTPGIDLIYVTLARLAAQPGPAVGAARTLLLTALARATGPQASIHRVLAMLAGRNRQLRESQLHWECVTQINPEETTALNELARGLLERDPAGALAMIERAIAVKDQPVLRGTRGQILSALGRQAEAIRDLNLALRAEPTHAGLHAALYQAYALHKMPEQAAQHLAAGAESRPELILYHARLLASQGDQAGAAAQAKKAADFFTARLAKDPLDLAARLQVADAAAFLKDYPAALKILQAGLEHLPAEDASSVTPAQYTAELRRAASLVQLAWAAEMGPAAPKEATPEQLARLAASLAADPVNSLTLATLQAIVDAGGPQAGAAKKIIDPVLAKEPRALEKLALASLQQQPPDAVRGLAWLDRALALDPQSISLRGTRARLLAALGKFSAAQADVEVALAAMPDNAELHAAAFEIYRGLGQQDLAVRHLEQAAAGAPALRLVYARYLDSLGDKAGGKSAAQEAQQAYLARLSAAPADRTTRLLAADAAMFLGDGAGAVQTLEAGLRLAPQDADLKRTLAQAYYLWSRAERPQASAPQTAAGLERLLKALEFDPEHRAALTDLEQSGQIEGPVAQRARERFQQLLGGASPSAAALFVASSQAWTKGDFKQALAQMEQAYKLNPQLTDAANNLAWMLYSTEGGDLKRAAELSDAALARSPNHPSYRGTRGHIRAKQGRWADARADLEFALRARPDAENQKVLAEVYKKLGLTGPGGAEPAPKQ